MILLRNLMLFALPLGIAAVLFAMAVGDRSAPAQGAPAEAPQPVRVITLTAGEVTPMVEGHATVRPEMTWRAVSEVSGRIARLAPALRQGAVLPAGTEIAMIDPRDYQIAVERAEASLAAARAELAEAKTDLSNAKAMRGLERETLNLQRADTERQRELIRSGTTARTTLNASERALLAQRVRMQELEGELARLAARIDRLTAQVAMAEADLAAAGEDLAGTRVVLPVDARVASVEVEAGEYVAANATLATLDGIARAEIVARLPEGAFARFLRLAGLGAEGGALPGVVAEVSALTGGVRSSWPAEVLHLTDGVAGDSRTIGVVLAVEDPLGRSAAGHPPLRKGAFVDVTLSAPPVGGRLRVPLSAVRDGRLHLADAEDRLRSVEIEIEARQGDWAVIAPGTLSPGDRVVLDDLVPAIPGMPLAPVEERPAQPAALSMAVIGKPAQ